MQRDLKNKMSKEKIFNASIAEFGTKTYENASLNNICNDNQISKGLIYHYFQNKDELYLNCVKACFEELALFLDSQDYDFTNFQKCIKKYMAARYEFFCQYPYYSYLFFNTLLQPPSHLKHEIKELRKNFDSQGVHFYKLALKHIVLRETVTEEEAMEYFFMFQEMFNGYFQSQRPESSNLNTLIEFHEKKLSKILNIMLYGIAKEEKNL